MFNKDEVEEKADQFKGPVKKPVGDLSDNEPLPEEGEVDEASGEDQEAVGKGERKVGGAIDEIGKNIKR